MNSIHITKFVVIFTIVKKISTCQMEIIKVLKSKCLLTSNRNILNPALIKFKTYFLQSVHWRAYGSPWCTISLVRFCFTNRKKIAPGRSICPLADFLIFYIVNTLKLITVPMQAIESTKSGFIQVSGLIEQFFCVVRCQICVNL